LNGTAGEENMRFYLIRLLAISFAFIVGLVAAWIWSLPSPTQLEEPLGTKHTVQLKPLTPELIEIIPPSPVSVDQSAKEKTQVRKSISITKHDSFVGVSLRLRKLPVFMKKNGSQTFNISDVNDHDGEYAYAFWKEENSIIVLNLPMYDEPTEADLYWLSGKAYRDLNKDVVSKELGNMGCCLVTKAWADQVVKLCKAGYKLKVTPDK
jgi:hypothetical protein